MDQLKIGKFIAERRKEKKMTQMQLAEKLNITDRAVSKWENGKNMPDSAIILELCDALEITVNDLLNGEIVSSENYTQKLNEQLLETYAQKEISDKRFRRFTICIGFAMIINFALANDLLLRSDLSDSWYFVVWLVILVLYWFVLFCCMMVIRYTGYYRCTKCGHTYTPSLLTVLFGVPCGWHKCISRCPGCKKYCKQILVWRKE